MDIKITNKNNKPIAIINSKEPLLTDIQSGLDLMATVKYEANASRIVLQKEAITEDFFILSTRFAGEMLQKFINYDVQMAIVGDFSKYTSKPLKDFMYESNRGKDFFFVSSEEEAIERLAIV